MVDFRWLEFTRQSNREEKSAQRLNFGGLQRVPSSIQQSTDLHTHVRKLPEDGKKPPTRLEGMVPIINTRLRIVPGTISWSGELHHYRALVEHSEEFA